MSPPRPVDMGSVRLSMAAAATAASAALPPSRRIETAASEANFWLVAAIPDVTVAHLRDRFDHAVAHPLASVAEHLDQVLQAALLAELDEGAVDLDLGQFAAMDELRVVIALDGGVELRELFEQRRGGLAVPQGRQDVDEILDEVGVRGPLHFDDVIERVKDHVERGLAEFREGAGEVR